MAKQYAVYHTEKGGISSGGIGNHIDRKEGAEWSYQHADPERIHLNENIIVTEHCSKKLSEAISDRISEGYNARNNAGELKAIRKDAVKYQTHIMSGSPEQMKKIEDNPELRKQWINSNLDFLKKEYGEKNIVRFTVHRDEKTMHIHAVTVPITQDGRLSAKEIMGNRKEMQNRQDRYADHVKNFGLERGERSTGISHENARQYYGRMQNALEKGNEQTEIKANKTILGINIGEDVQKTNELLKVQILAQKTALESLKNENERKEKQIKEVAEKKNFIEKQKENATAALKEYQKKSNEMIRAVALSPEKSEKFREDLKLEAIKKIGSDISNAKEPINTQKVDEIIRTRMKELNPSENPWTTLNKHFGEDAEKKIQKLAEKKNELLQEKQKEQKQENRFTQTTKNREEKQEEPERKKGRRM
jgi:hypothetical protein